MSGFVHAKAVGTASTACGRNASSWIKFWDVPFSSILRKAYPDCREASADGDTLALTPEAGAPPHLFERHFTRKHGPGALLRQAGLGERVPRLSSQPLHSPPPLRATA